MPIFHKGHSKILDGQGPFFEAKKVFNIVLSIFIPALINLLFVRPEKAEKESKLSLMTEMAERTDWAK